MNEINLFVNMHVKKEKNQFEKALFFLNPLVALHAHKKREVTGLLAGDVSMGCEVQISPGPLLLTPGPLCII